MTASPAGEHAPQDVELLVGDWASLPEIADQYGMRLSDVRQWLKDGVLIAMRVGPNRAVQVPARLLADEGPLPALRGTVIVLRDGGMQDEDVIRWLFTPDASLPVDGAPVDAMLAGFKTEVRRRAAELAW